MTKSEAINQLMALAVCSIQNQGIECAEYCPFGKVDDDCISSDCYQLTDESIAEAVKTLRAQSENKPLTLDELRQMDGEPIWMVWPDGRIKSRWYIVGSTDWNNMDFFDEFSMMENDYGKTWLAYREKPKEEV